MFFEQLGPLQRHDSREYDELAWVTQHPDRPKPARAADQIYMLPGSQLTQVKLIAPYLQGRSVVFVGDGDAMALSLHALYRAGVLAPQFKPHRMLVLDFDTRIVRFVREIAKTWGISDELQARHYNVAHALPSEILGSFDLFYVNPPYGSRNQGFSGVAFVARGIELMQDGRGRGIAVVPFYPEGKEWTRTAMLSMQELGLAQGYVVGEMLTGMHTYHLDNRPQLKSGTVVFEQVRRGARVFCDRRALTARELSSFYGSNSPEVFPEGVDVDGTFIFDLDRIDADLLRIL